MGVKQQQVEARRRMTINSFMRTILNKLDSNLLCSRSVQRQESRHAGRVEIIRRDFIQLNDVTTRQRQGRGEINFTT